jgi:hypothetical protein
MAVPPPLATCAAGLLDSRFNMAAVTAVDTKPPRTYDLFAETYLRR